MKKIIVLMMIFSLDEVVQIDIEVDSLIYNLNLYYVILMSEFE